MFKYFLIMAFLFASCDTVQQPTQIEKLPSLPTCHINGALPDSSCTPGAVFSLATKDQICQPGYAASVRNVPQEIKDKVYQEYGITSHPTGSYEIDHLISLELGGSNDIKNLWPESYIGKENAHIKDGIENLLHMRVCNGNITLVDAQNTISTDWTKIQ